MDIKTKLMELSRRYKNSSYGKYLKTYNKISNWKYIKQK